MHAGCREGLVAEGHLVQRVQSTHLQMLEAGTLGGWTRGVIVAEDSLHEVPGQQQAAGSLSGYPCRSLGALSPEVRSRAWRRPGRASCMVI